MSIEENKSLVLKMVDELFVKGNSSKVDELLSPNFIEHEQLPPGIPTGREGLKQLITILHSAFPDFNAKVEDIIAADDKVVIRMTWQGTQKGEFIGMPPSNKSMTINVFDILRVMDGKVVEHWGLFDSMSMMQQLGAIPAPGTH